MIYNYYTPNKFIDLLAFIALYEIDLISIKSFNYSKLLERKYL